ncbi:porin family protein [uncultured Apibacter sp.]|uniref:type IX secretion/gliding motility protein PorT/SprT n=1 Tax=uncultured Apibacter sp. TaxID=1778616 RepID=UPI0025E3FC3B|nr:porin family protein [uncultured Apibacter sp.]
MKRLIIVLILFIHCGVNAQFRTREVMERYDDFDDQKFSWGYYLGMNYFDLKIHPNDEGLEHSGRYLVDVDSKGGFTVGLIGKMKVHDYIDLRLEPAMHFTQRDLIFNNVQKIIDEEIANGLETTYTEQDVKRNVKSTYLDFPLFLKFHGERWYNSRPYLQAGLSWLINLQSNEKKEKDNSNQTFRMKTNNFSYQLEAGVELYFKRFKMTPSVRGIFFFNNELVADNPGTPPYWAGALKSIHTRAVVFSLKFE